MKRRSCCSSVGDPFSRNDAPTDRASASFSARLDCSMTGTSGWRSRTRRANSRPASGAFAPPRGNSMSEITPRMLSS